MGATVKGQDRITGNKVLKCNQDAIERYVRKNEDQDKGWKHDQHELELFFCPDAASFSAPASFCTVSGCYRSVSEFHKPISLFPSLAEMYLSYRKVRECELFK